MNIETTKTAVPALWRLGKLVPNPNARLREQFHEVARFKYLASRTEATYWQWVVRYLKFHRREGQWVHPRELKAQDIAAFLSDLASRQKVAAATQAQALNALVFLYREVLHVLVEEIGEFERVRRALTRWRRRGGVRIWKSGTEEIQIVPGFLSSKFNRRDAARRSRNQRSADRRVRVFQTAMPSTRGLGGPRSGKISAAQQDVGR